MAAPGLEGGRTVEALLQPADIAPTLLDLAGVAADPPEPMHGRSFAPLLRNDGSEGHRDCVVTAKFTRLERGVLPAEQNMPAVYSERWCYVPVGSYGGRQLFDLSSDPQAETNLINDHAEVADDLHDALIEELRKLDAPQEAVEVWAKRVRQ